ncbi:Family S53 protease-like protein [Mycena sanguinolenta]|uniref:Family S53 protease-like protein n=1 Tax=Mycena sanguinolenta TaxID=230812 RepID=A0A8H6XU48_9AGAR|nr:Family S53 protease-like protein [Mycena sanguinolenta]
MHELVPSVAVLMPFRKLATFFAIICAVSGSLVVHESRRAAPTGFFSQGPAPATDVLTLRFGLTPNNLGGLQEKLVAISTPGSSEFRQWLSKDEVKSFVQPSNETVVAFNSFAVANGLKPTVISPHGDWVSVALMVSEANHLFGAQFEKFSHASLTEPITRTLAVSLPSELIGHVDIIHPTTSFAGRNPDLSQLPFYHHRSEKRTEPAASCNSSNPDGHVTPTCLQNIYGIPSAPATQKNNKILVTGYLGASPIRTDISTFLEQFRPDIPQNTTFDLITIDNATNQDPEDVPPNLVLEADLDVEYTSIGLATGVPVDFLSVGGPPDSDFSDLATAFLDTNTFLAGLDSPPSVVTTSYSPMENQFEGSVARKLCDGYMALGARGISVLFSSGDGGVRGSHDNSSIPGDCEGNTFIPLFPPSCPYVTAVGATQGFNPEIAANFTGGGFSDLFPRPWYQTQAVDSFLKTIPPDFAGTFNKSGRGYPDVAVQGVGLDLVIGGTTFPGIGAGTSFSAPIFASIIALINDRLLAAGKPVVGFMNPWLYAHSEAFTDITEGHNSGSECPASSSAFDATAGWDALTGVGSPVFDKLLTAAFEY